VPFEGQCGSYYDFDDIEITATAGVTYSIEILDAGFDTYRHLTDELCTVVASKDDGGYDLFSLIVFTPTVSGVYAIVVTSYGSDVTGCYDTTLSVY